MKLLDYIIFPWMIEDLHLSGDALIAFAVINTHKEYRYGYDSLARILLCNRHSAERVVGYLIRRGLVGIRRVQEKGICSTILTSLR